MKLTTHLALSTCGFLLAASIAVSAAQTAEPTVLTIFAAGTLAGPFKQVNAPFEKQNPDVTVHSVHDRHLCIDRESARHSIGRFLELLICQCRSAVERCRSYQSPSGCGFTTWIRWRIMNRPAGFSAIATLNATCAKASERQIASVSFLRLCPLCVAGKRPTKSGPGQ
jgi:hypothetical protein